MRKQLLFVALLFGLSTAHAATTYQFGVQAANPQLSCADLSDESTLCNSYSAGSNKITSLADGVAATDAVTLGQLTAAVEGRKIKDPAKWTTTGNITLSGLGTQGNGEWTGSLTAADRILVKDQTTSADKGIYAADSGAWTRVTDSDTAAEITNASVLILNGANIGDTYTQTLTVTTIGTDPQTWSQTGDGATYAAGAGLDLTSSTFSIGTAEVTNAMLADMAQSTFKMRAAAAGTGVPIDGTATQAKTALAITMSDVSGDAAIASSGSASDLVAGTVPAARGGAGTISGLLKADGAGLVSVATSGSDYAPATSGTDIARGNGAGGFNYYAGTSCTNQFIRSLSTAAAATCASVALSSDVSGTLAAAQFPALTGPITTTAGSLATSVTNNSITTAMQSQMAAHTFKGNNTGSTANEIDLTQVQLTAEINPATTLLPGSMSAQDKIKSTGCNLSADVTSSGTGTFVLFTCQIDANTTSTGDTYDIFIDGVTAALGNPLWSVAVGATNPATTVAWTTAVMTSGSAAGGGISVRCTVKSATTITCAGFGRVLALVASSATATAQTIAPTSNWFITGRVAMSASTFRATNAFIKKM